MSKALLLALTLAASSAQAAAFKVPPLSGAVVDQAGMLSPATRSALDQTLRQLWNSGGSQIAVLTVENLGGLEIEPASIQVTDQWKLGSAKGDNGVLLMIAKTERSARIEVGQGLEGSLPDAYARRIIDDILAPQFKEGAYDDGIVQAVWAIAARTDPDRKLGVGAASGQRDLSPRPVSNFFPFIIFLVIMLASIVPRLFGFSPRARRSGMWGSSGGWGGGGWGGGGGGGGFSGGGGGFSGGGASGKW